MSKHNKGKKPSANTSAKGTSPNLAQKQSPQTQPRGTTASKSKDPLVNALAYCVAPQNEKHQTELVPIIEELLNIRNNDQAAT